MNDPIIVHFMVEAKKALAEMAEDSMVYPKHEPFEHGVQVGKYQGIRFALELLDSILRDEAEKENHS